MGMPTGFDPTSTKACFKHSRWFGKWHKTDAFTKLGEPTIRPACTPQTVLDWHFWCFFCFFYQYLAIFPTVSLYPQQKRACSALHLQALTKCKSPGFPKIVYCALCYVIGQCLTCYRRHQKCRNRVGSVASLPCLFLILFLLYNIS